MIYNSTACLNRPYRKTHFDYANRPYKTTYPDGTITQTVYGLLTTGELDQNGHYTETEVAGNTRTAREFTGVYTNTTTDLTPAAVSNYFTEYSKTVTTEYRGGSQVTDNKGNRTTNVINMLGRRKQITSPDAGTWSFDYDTNGNMLTQTDARGNTIRYSYDNINRLITITYPDNTKTEYYYDGGMLNRVKYYPGGSVRSTVNGLVYVYKDISGNTAAITSASGIKIKTMLIAPFGTDTLESAGMDFKYKFAGGEKDASGLSSFGARYYDSTLCRFITPDTIVPEGSPQCLNRYAYCINNPVNYSDPSGHDLFSGFTGFFENAAARALGSNGLAGFFMNTLISGYRNLANIDNASRFFRYTYTPFDKFEYKEIHFGAWLYFGGEISINLETGDIAFDVGVGMGAQGGLVTQYGDIDGDCSYHMGVGYNTADKSIFFKASYSASLGKAGYGGSVTVGYSFKYHVGYQSVNVTAGLLSYGWSVYDGEESFYYGFSFGGLSATWSNKDGFSPGYTLSDMSGNSVGVTYNVSNGGWRGTVGIDMCFVAGTEMETIDGEKNIEDIEAGDIVKSYDEATGTFG